MWIQCSLRSLDNLESLDSLENLDNLESLDPPALKKNNL